MTITEALAEIKTIAARTNKKRQSVAEYVTRDSRMKDPLEKDGGSASFIARERQAILDLQQRVVDIRIAIQAANLGNDLTIRGKTRSVAAWLTWRREVSKEQQNFLNALKAGLKQVRDQYQKHMTGQGQDYRPDGLVVNLDEAQLATDVEEIEHVLGDLDGKLSLFNARKEVDV